MDIFAYLTNQNARLIFYIQWLKQQRVVYYARIGALTFVKDNAYSKHSI